MSDIAPLLLDARQSAALLGVSLRLYVDLAKAPGFPAARSLGPRCTRWVRSELEAYAMALPKMKRSDAEPSQLAAARAAKAVGRQIAPAPFGGQA